MLHIILSINDQSGKYHKHSMVTMASVMEHTSCPVCFHVLHDDTLLPNVNTIEGLVKRYQQNIKFYNMCQHDFSGLEKYAGKWGKGALYRLYLHEYVNTDMALYLDSDIVVTMDLAELLMLDMNKLSVAVVLDKPVESIPKEHRKRVQRLGLSPDKYFNSGVMLFNINYLRENAKEFSNLIISALRAGAQYPDQDVLNIFYSRTQESVCVLENRFNCQISYVKQERYVSDFSWYDGKILHFSNRHKPWDYFSNAAMLYWKYYAIAFPQENVMENICNLSQHTHNQIFRYALSSPRVRGMLRRLRDIAEGGLWYTIHKRIFPKKKS